MDFCLHVEERRTCGYRKKHVFPWNMHHVFKNYIKSSTKWPTNVALPIQLQLQDIQAMLQTTNGFSLNSMTHFAGSAKLIQAKQRAKQAYFNLMLLVFTHFLSFFSSLLRWTLCLGHQEFWECADPSAATIPSRCRGHEDLPYSLWVPSPAGLQELHPLHHSPGNGHPAAGRQPQQSLRYNNHVLGYTLHWKLYLYSLNHLKLPLLLQNTLLHKGLWHYVTSHLMIHQFPLK